MALQTGYEHHSENFYDNQAAEEKAWDRQQYFAAQNKDIAEEHHDTINQGDLYNGMAVQLGYENHSKTFYQNQEAEEKQWNRQQSFAETN